MKSVYIFYLKLRLRYSNYCVASILRTNMQTQESARSFARQSAFDVLKEAERAGRIRVQLAELGETNVAFN